MAGLPEKPVFDRMVVLTGISGVDLGRITSHVERVFRAPVYKFEEYLSSVFKAPIYHVAELLLAYYSNTAPKFIRAFEELLGDARSNDSSRLVVAMHLTYHRRRHIIPNPVLHLMGRIARKTVIVNYVDDYYHILKRLLDRVVRGQTPGVAGAQVLDPISILYWRAADHSYATFFAAGGIEVIQFANKHSVETHTRLLAYALGVEYQGVKNYRKVYVSHPITMVRKLAEEKGVPLNRFPDALEIEEFKRLLEAKCRDLIVFSPTSVDELILRRPKPSTEKSEEREGGEKGVEEEPLIETRITREVRWPHPDGLHDYPYPVDLADKGFNNYLFPVDSTVKNPGYLKVVRSLVEAQIESRDLAYVTQADMVVAYRPRMYGALHSGVETEIKTAVAQTKPVYSIMPKEDGSYEYSLFRLEYQLSDVEELLSVLHC